MNETTKITESVRKKVLEIMELAMLINDSPTKQRLTGEKPTVFIEFSGHCCSLDVKIYPKGWKADSDELKDLCKILCLSEENVIAAGEDYDGMPTEEKLSEIISILAYTLYNIQQKEKEGNDNEQ